MHLVDLGAVYCAVLIEKYSLGVKQQQHQQQKNLEVFNCSLYQHLGLLIRVEIFN